MSSDSRFVPNPSATSEPSLKQWRINSPFLQTFIVGVVVFCGPGINTAVIGLGAGGSHPTNIPVVDKINIVVGTLIVVAGILGGSVNNQLGPKYTLMLGASGYPIYIGWLDQGRGPEFPYFVAVYHGICAGLLYTAAGYIATSYAPEQHRGKYVASIYFFLGAGSAVGSGIVLGITSTSSVNSSHVPSTVYISTIAIQCFGILVAAFLLNPAKIRRNDGQGIAYFRSSTWLTELSALPESIMTPSILLTSVALFSCQMPFSLTGSMNAFYFNSRARALANFCFWLSSACGSVGFAFICDHKCFGHRRKRGLVASAVAAVLIIGSNSGVLTFLAKYNLNRHGKAPGIDWNDSNEFTGLLIPYIFLGCSTSVFQAYLMWLCSTFSNEPTILSRYSGYIEALKALGLITAFGIDSNHTSFMTEEIVYFSLNVVGLILCFLSAFRYTENTKYGHEEFVIVPKGFQMNESLAGQDFEVQNLEVTMVKQ